MTAGSALGQGLELSVAPSPPRLVAPTYVGLTIGLIEGEVEQLGLQERRSSQAPRTVLRALMSLRLATVEMLEAGEKHDDGELLVHTGLTLAHLRHDLDTLLPRLTEQPVDETAMQLLAAFDDLTVDHAEALRSANGQTFESALTTVFRPLREAAERAEMRRRETVGEPVLSPRPMPWPSVQVIHSSHSAAPTAGALRQILASLTLPDEIRRPVTDILQQLERAAKFPEFAVARERGLGDVHALLMFAQSVQDSSRLTDEMRATQFDRIHATAKAYAAPATRKAARAWIEHGVVSAKVLRGLESLDASRSVQRTLIGGLAVAEVIPRGGTAAPLNARALPVPPDADRLIRLEVILRRMIAFRERPAVEVPRELQRTRARLVERYELAERVLLKAIDGIISGQSPVTQPAVQSMLADQRQRLRDLQRVDRIPEWRDAITAMDERAGAGLGRWMRKWSGWLLEPARRDAAVERLESFEQQYDRYLPQIPFEVELERATTVAMMGTGGLHRELLAIISSERRRWAEGWGRGDRAEENEDIMRQLTRLGETLTEAAPMIGNPSMRDTLANWGAWEAPNTLIARSLSDLPGRLKLACAAARDRQWKTLEEQLSRIDDEAPMVRLLGVLALRLRSQLNQPTAPVLAGLDQITIPPGKDAWLGEQRRTFALLCRYLIEADYARQTDREVLQEVITTYVNEQARRLRRIAGQ